MKKSKRPKKLNNFFELAESLMSPDDIQVAKLKAKNIILKLKLAEMRKKYGIKQTDIPGFSQVSVSRIESRNDIKVSTLIDYIHACGMELEIKAIPNNKKSDKFLLLKG